jgi:hypothetical protein
MWIFGNGYGNGIAGIGICQSQRSQRSEKISYP